MVWYGVYLFNIIVHYLHIYIAHHYNITQDAEREMHEVQYLYVAYKDKTLKQNTCQIFP